MSAAESKQHPISQSHIVPLPHDGVHFTIAAQPHAVQHTAPAWLMHSASQSEAATKITEYAPSFVTGPWMLPEPCSEPGTSAQLVPVWNPITAFIFAGVVTPSVAIASVAAVASVASAGPNAEGATAFVLGSAIPHPHDLVLGRYSVIFVAAEIKKGNYFADAFQHKLFYFHARGENTDGPSSQDTSTILYVDDAIASDPGAKCP